MKLAPPPISQEIVSVLTVLINAEPCFDAIDLERIEWDKLVPLLHMHALGSRFTRVATRGGFWSAIPEACRRVLSTDWLRAQQMHALAEAYSGSLVGGLERAGIETVFMKGWSLATRLYDEPIDRGFDDIDLLFREDDREGVDAHLRAHGYELLGGEAKWEANAHKAEYALIANPNVKVEAHFATGYGRFALKGVFERAVEVDGFRVMAPEDEYLYLVYHAGVQHRFHKLVWLLDLAQFQRAALTHPTSVPDSLRPSVRIAEYFVDRFANGRSVKPNRSLDAWYRAIASGALEFSALKRARLRARLQGGWSTLAKYAAQRAIAVVR